MKWTKLGTNPLQYEPVRYKAHPPNYFIDSFPKYLEGNWIESEQYWFSIINLDFYPLIQLRENLFIAYTYMFLNDKLFQEINYRIYYLIDFATSKTNRELNLYSDDVNFLTKRRNEISKLLEDTNERLNQFKYQYVNTLNSHNLDLFNSHFYTYPKMYEDILQTLDLRIYMYTFHYDKNTGTFPEKYTSIPPTFNEYRTGYNESQKTKPSPNTNKIKKLKPNRSFNFIYQLFLEIKKSVAIETNNLEGFIYKSFDYNNTQYDNLDSNFKINTYSEIVGAFFYDLRTSDIISTDQTYEEIWDIIENLKLRNNRNQLIKISSLRASFNNDSLNTYIQKGKHLLTNEILNTLSSIKK